MTAKHRACTHRLLKNGVHEFTFHDRTRRTVDEYVEHLALITNANAPDTQLYFIINIEEGGIPPIAYLSRRIKDTLSKLSHRLPSRTVLLHNNNPMVMMLADTAIRMMASMQIDSVRVFHRDQWDSAVEWLLAE
jgi:hypothetical protein